MIVGTRNREGTTGDTPGPKKFNLGDQGRNDNNAMELSDDMSEKEMMKAMMKVIIDVKKDTAQAKYSADVAAAAADNATAEIKNMKATIGQLQAKDAQFEKDIADIKTQLTNLPNTPYYATPTHVADDSIRELQVVVKGLKDELDEDVIKQQMTKVIQQMNIEQKVDKCFTFTDPSRIGVMQFKSIGAKFGFLKKVNQLEVKWDNGGEMRFNSNDTPQQRTLDKELGFIKHQLINTRGVQHVKIQWKKKPKVQVESQGTLLAEVGDDNTVKYMGEALKVKDAVKDLLKEWKEKRNFD